LLFRACTVLSYGIVSISGVLSYGANLVQAHYNWNISGRPLSAHREQRADGHRSAERDVLASRTTTKSAQIWLTVKKSDREAIPSFTEPMLIQQLLYFLKNNWTNLFRVMSIVPGTWQVMQLYFPQKSLGSFRFITPGYFSSNPLY
jgi:hypothetical protein